MRLLATIHLNNYTSDLPALHPERSAPKFRLGPGRDIPRWGWISLDAIASSRPRPRYPSGIMARVLIPLHSALSDRWLDALLRRSLKLRPGP